MDLNSGRIYETREAAIASGVSKGDVRQVAER